MQGVELNVDQIADEEWKGDQRIFLQKLVEMWVERGLMTSGEAVGFADDLFDLDASFGTLRRILRETILKATEERDNKLLLEGLAAYSAWLSEIQNHAASAQKYLDKAMDAVESRL